MAELMNGERKPSGTLLLQIDNREPIPLPLMASLLTALSGDYRGATGHDLILARVEQGSIILHFVDLAAHANELIEFGKNLAELAMLAGGGYFVLRGRRRKGVKTVQSIVELAAKTGSEVTVYHQDKDGETLFVHMTPDAARSIQERAAADQTEAKSRQDRLEVRPGVNVAVKALEDFLATAADDGLSPGDTEDGLMVLLVEVIRAVRARPDGSAVLNTIRSNLLSSGRNKAAALLDELIRK